MTTADAIIQAHLREARFYLDSLTREERRGGPYVIEIVRARYVKRIDRAAALLDTQIERRAMLGVLDARRAALVESAAPRFTELEPA